MEREKKSKRSLRSTLSVSEGNPNMEYPAVAHPTTNVLATAHEGNSDFEIYIRATLTKIQQQLDDVKQSNNDSKSGILKSLDFSYAQVKELHK